MGTNPHTHHHPQPSHLLTKKKILRAIYILAPLALLHFYLSPLPLIGQRRPPQTPTAASNYARIQTPGPPVPSPRKARNPRPAPACDYSRGQWAPTTRGPLYNGTTCGTIKDGQNCMAHGRPDTGYLFYRWRPDACDLGPFNPSTFLSLIRNQHLAFVGDSMARNQLESLLCLLSTASSPELVYRGGDDDKFRRWVFGSHNATVSVFWSPFLVDGVEKSAASNHNELYLERVDRRWASELGRIDLVVFSIGHWFLHPAVYYENDQVLGCHHCPGFNHTEIGFFEVFRKAIRTALKGVRERNSAVKFVTVTTFSPAHFEGEWDKAGACPRKVPYREGEKEMEYMDKEMRRVEVEEVAAAAAAAAEGGGERVEIEALDVTAMAMLRADGHPGPYMHPNPFGDGEVRERVQNDCVHWCLPGPIDAWNEILLEMVKRWKERRSVA